MSDLGAGFGYLMKGQRWVAQHGRWFGFGLLPGLVTLVVYAGALIGLGYGADDFVGWATPFADDWSSPWQGILRTGLTALVFVFGLFLAVITFTAVTLLVGQPFYESLSEEVDRSEGGDVPESGLPLWRELWISARDSLRILLRVALYGIILFACGFIPVIGQTVVPAIGFCVSGYFLAEELTAVALQRRGMILKDRLVLLRGRRMLVLGFGVPLTLAFLVPFVAVFLMPGAVAGATLLARDLVDPDAAPDPGPGPGTADSGDAPAPPGVVRMTELLAVAAITVLAVISPGADFAMVVRNSYLYGRTTGVLAATGVAAGVLVHVTYTMLGVGLLIASSTALFTAVKLAGAAYLIYIGVRTFLARADLDVDLTDRPGLSPFGALRSGFLTNALNPKTTLFVVATFTQVVGPDTALWQQAGYGLFMSAAHLGWFALVALFFSHSKLRGAMLRRQKALNRSIGSVLVGLGVTLGLAR